MNWAETGNSIGISCARTIKLSTMTLTASLVVQGVIHVGNVLELIEKPVQRLAVMSGLVMGASAAGCLVGAFMSGAISGKSGKTNEENGDLSNEERYRLQRHIEARDREIFRRGRVLAEVRQELTCKEQELEDWKNWWELARSLDDNYSIIGCKGCKYFVGSKDGGNLFVCAMHPYGQRACEDWEERTAS